MIKQILLVSIAGILGGFFAVEGLPIQIRTDRPVSTVSVSKPMSLTIAAQKAAYFQLEPISLNCKFSNETRESQTILPPDFLMDGHLEISFEGQKNTFSSLTEYRVLLARVPVTFAPGQGFEKEIFLETDLDQMFPKAGLYTISLSLQGSGNSIKSNPVSITIAAPQGIDKEAFDFIQANSKYRRHYVLFSWDDGIKLESGKTILEEFVDKYGTSMYGEMAIYQLGIYYFSNHQFDKAKVQLERLKSSTDPQLLANAKGALEKVERLNANPDYKVE